MYVNYLKNPLKTFFCQNCNLFMADICKNEAKTQKQKKSYKVCLVTIILLEIIFQMVSSMSFFSFKNIQVKKKIKKVKI